MKFIPPKLLSLLILVIPYVSGSPYEPTVKLDVVKTFQIVKLFKTAPKNYESTNNSFSLPKRGSLEIRE